MSGDSYSCEYLGYEFTYHVQAAKRTAVDDAIFICLRLLSRLFPQNVAKHSVLDETPPTSNAMLKEKMHFVIWSGGINVFEKKHSSLRKLTKIPVKSCR